MGRKPRFLIIFAVMLMHLLLVENHVKSNSAIAAPSHINISSAATISEAPTPQPQTSSNHHMHGTTQGSLQPEDCGGRCRGRCSKTAFKKPCMFFCNKCCAKCLCVPPGTFGNKLSCPCYNDWKTKRGGPKCP